MLQLFQSNRIEAMVTLVASQIRSNPLSNPLATETILVQSPGMSQWLKLQLAQQNGIAANIDFPLPSSFIWRVYQTLLPDVPKQSPFNKDKMTWRLYSCLAHLEQDPSFEPLQDYIHANESVTQEKTKAAVVELRRFKLAEKIADVFDNYLMYRPHWLEHWLLGQDDLPDESEIEKESVVWQAKLWRLCHQQILDSYSEKGEKAWSRAELHGQAIKRIQGLSKEQAQDLFPQRVFIFGVTTLNQQQLELFQALAQKVDVQLFRLNPCKEYWGDVLSQKSIAKITQEQSGDKLAERSASQVSDSHYFVTGNPLLASWGKVGKDNNELINQSEPSQTDVFIEPVQDQSVLHLIQQDIFDLTYRGQVEPLSAEQLNSDFGKRNLVQGDDSLSIHCCHSVVRELEVLKDQLISWFTQSKLDPQDVLVMVPDINIYAPYIDSIFGQDNEGVGTIPYSISDRSDLSQHPVLQAFLNLFQLPQSRFTASELIGLLEIPQVCARFEIDTNELHLIKQWLHSSHIRWGIDKTHKTQWDLPAFELNTWLYGMRSLFAGLSEATPRVWQQTYANPDVEGLETELLGKLLDFLSYLVVTTQKFDGDFELKQWQMMGLELLSGLFADTNTEPAQQYVVNKIRTALAHLSDYQLEGDYQHKVNNLVIYHLLKQTFNSSGVNQSFVAGRVNFCTLMPMRSVPFAAICVLGLNESDYPRQVDPISFDLVGKLRTRKGDRSRKLDDRYLFLEALCSARTHFYASYLAFSVKDNSAMVPSILLSELVEYIDDSFLPNQVGIKASEQLTRIEKLQPFAKEYFQSSNEGVGSYNRKWFAVADEIQGGNESHTKSSEEDERDKQQLETESTAEIELEQLISFWRHPIKHYYLTELETRLEVYVSEQSDVEVFSHDGLQRYEQVDSLLQQAVFSELFIDQNVDLLSGAYPHGEWGQSLREQYLETITSIVDGLECLLGDKVNWQRDAKSALVKLDTGLRCTANIELINGVYVFLRPGKVRFVDKLMAFINHLAICSQRPQVSILASLDNKWQKFESITCEQAKGYLHDFIVPYLQSLSGEPLYWHPLLADTWLKLEQDLSNVGQVKHQLAKSLEPNPFGVSLADDDYVVRHKEQYMDNPDTALVLNQSILVPMFELITEAPPAKLAMGEE